MKSLHCLECKNFIYDATKTANQKLNRKNRYLQTLTRRKNIIVTIQIIYRIALTRFYKTFCKLHGRKKLFSCQDKIFWNKKKYRKKLRKKFIVSFFYGFTIMVKRWDLNRRCLANNSKYHWGNTISLWGKMFMSGTLKMMAQNERIRNHP